MKRTYIIWVPHYSRSNGIRALLNLGNELRRKGHEAFYYVDYKYGWDYEKYPNVIKKVKPYRKTGIAVYPEIVVGNPFRFQNVVRYVLYHPGRNGGLTSFHPSEKIFTFLPEFYPNVPMLFIPWMDKTLFYDDHRPKTKNCTFVYKGGKCREVPEAIGCVEITMTFPPTRTELAELLRETNTLYSYDSCSAVLDEALLCGAHVKIITPTEIKDYASVYSTYEPLFPAQLQNFIEITQALHYTGKLQRKFFPVHSIKSFISYSRLCLDILTSNPAEFLAALRRRAYSFLHDTCGW